MKSKKDANTARVAILLLIMLAAAALGSRSAAVFGERWTDRLLRPGFKTAALFNAFLSALIFISGFFGGGSFIALIAAGVKGFALSAFATLIIKTYGLRGYASCAPAFAGGAVSTLGIILLSLRAVDLSVLKRYNNIKADGSYYAAAAVCLLLCTAGAFLVSL